MMGSVGLQHAGREEDAHSEGRSAVGADVENVFRAGGKRIVRQRRTLPDEVVFVNQTGLRGIGFEAAYGHGTLPNGNFKVLRNLEGGIVRGGSTTRWLAAD